MKRTKDTFIENLSKHLVLKNKTALEIGCGNGSRSVQIAAKVKHLTSIEPNSKLIKEANRINAATNVIYQVGSAEKLKFPKGTFDITIFTLSLHHVPAKKMDTAIKEAVRVTKKGGYVVFLEPTHEGSFFESEVMFDACDGDERKAKAFAYYSILNHKGYEEALEISDETAFQFESVDDFVQSMNPKKNKKDIKAFLEKYKYMLDAKRRINIFRV